MAASKKSTISRQLTTIKEIYSTKQQEQFEKVDRRLQQINADLKTHRNRVAIVRKSGSLILKATLPLRPGEPSTDGCPNKQYQIALGIPANLEGVKIAHKEALELGLKIATKTFTWELKYLGKQAQRALIAEAPKTIGGLIELVKQNYLKNKSANATKTRRSWDTTYAATFNRLPQEELLSASILDSLLRSTDANSAARLRDCQAIQKLCNVAGFPFDAEAYRGEYFPKERRLPSDAEIEQCFYRILAVPDRPQNKNNQASKAWYFGMLAAYGLRTAEVFLINWDLSFQDFRHTIQVSSSTKTSKPRVVYPLLPSWVEKFDLLNVKMPLLDCAVHRRANKINAWLDAAGIEFAAYNLRHRYAIRGHELGIKPTTMAKWMGHTLRIHTTKYQQYMDTSSFDLEFDTIFPSRTP